MSVVQQNEENAAVRALYSDILVLLFFIILAVENYTGIYSISS